MQLVDRILELIDFLSNKEDGCTISEMSEHLNIPISSVHRMLSSLKKRNYVVQDIHTKKYKLGVKMLNLAINLFNNMDIRVLARPFMEELSIKHEEVMFLTIMENERAICIDTVMASTGIKFFVKIGSEMPINAAVAAQVILAYQDPKTIHKVIRSVEHKKYTPRSLVEIEEIEKRLEEITNNGFGICDEELEVGVRAISAPIKDLYGKVIASITMVGFKNNDEVTSEKINNLKETARSISNALGHRS